MKKIILLFFLFFGISAMTMAQRTVEGMVTDADGVPLIGANVLVPNTTIGTITDIDGSFMLEVPDGTTELEVSYTGFGTKMLSILGTDRVDVALSAGELLDEVVVTALGISRDKKSLGYATQEVDGDEVTRTTTSNFVNNLSGKVSGVQIKTNNNFGGSTNVVIRGNSSLTGNNQALFVIDGVPVNNSNTNTGSQKAGGVGYDYGNAASDINPNDIESINVLKGAAATALYGSRAANGVVIITTKKGAKKEGIGVTVNSSLTTGAIDKSTFITYQDKYGAGYGPYYGSTGYFEDVDVDGDGTDDLVVPTYDDASFGAPFDPNLNVYQWESFIPESDKYGTAYPYVAAKNTPVDFFENELTFNNSISLHGGNDNGSFRLGYTNYNTEGVLPNSELKKNIINLNSAYNLTDRLTASVGATYTNQDAKGRNSTGYNDNLMTMFRQWWQVNVDVESLKNLYDATGRNVTWNSTAPWAGNFQPQYWDNPYWTRYENFQTDTRDRVIGNVALNYQITDWLDVMGRVTLDHYNDLREERRAVGSVATAFGVLRAEEQSGYQRYELGFTETNYDLILTANKYLTDDLSVKAFVGSNIRKSKDERTLSSTSGGLIVPGLYSLSNSVNSNPNPFEALYERQVNGYFGGVSLGYKNFLYVDLTDRVDVSSTLPIDNNTFNYYSASLGLIFSELMNEDWLDFGKVRLSYGEVGNDAPALSVYNTYVKNANFGNSVIFSVPSTSNNPELKPERTKSYEIGLEMKTLNNRVGFDIAYYNNRTVDQILPVSVSPATGSSRRFVNSGEVENKGIELALNLGVVRTDAFGWDVGVNWTRNRNKVISLYEGVDNLQLARFQGGLSINATVGQPYGTLRGTGFKYNDAGQKVVNESGYYIAEADQLIGDSNPNWIGGLSNRFTFGNVALNFLIDVQQGGDVYSLDLHYGQGTGLPDYTAGTNANGKNVRDAVADGGGVLNEGVKEDGTANDTYARADYYGGAYYWGNASRNPGQLTVYDASFVKLREVGLSYNVPNSLFKNTFIGGATLSVVGRNLWIIHKNLPFADPESGLTSGNAQGYVSGSYPTVRTIGVNLKLDF